MKYPSFSCSDGRSAGFVAHAAGDVRAQGVDAGDVADRALPLGPQRHGQRQVPAARLAGHDEVGDAELVAVVGDPGQRGHAVVEAGGVRVDAELARPVAVLHTDDDEAGRGQLVAPADVLEAGRLEDDHPTAVDVEHGREGTGGAGRTVDVQADLVAVPAGDGARLRLHALDRGQPVVEGGEHAAEPGLGRGAELQLLVAWGVRCDGRRRSQFGEPERGQRGDQAGIGPGIGPQ